MNLPVLEIGNKQFNSRLILGTGKYPSLDTALQSIEYSQTEMVTVAIRRLQKDIHSTQEKNLIQSLDWDKLWLLPNTAGSKTAEDAIRMALLGREFAKQIRDRRRRKSSWISGFTRDARATTERPTASATSCASSTLSQRSRGRPTATNDAPRRGGARTRTTDISAFGYAAAWRQTRKCNTLSQVGNLIVPDSLSCADFVRYRSPLWPLSSIELLNVKFTPQR